MIIREITPANYPILEEFLYNAVFIPEGEKMPPREIIFEPEIHVYIKGFGVESDCGVVAEQDGVIIGAAWTRIIPAYGHIDNETRTRHFAFTQISWTEHRHKDDE